MLGSLTQVVMSLIKGRGRHAATTPARSRHSTQLSLESLEDRLVPALALVGQTNLAVATLYDPHSAWIDQHIHDPAIRASVRQLDADYQLSRNDMVTIFQQVSTHLYQQNRGLSTMEYGDLETLVHNAAFFQMPDYVHNLANKVVNFDPADAHFLGTALEPGGLHAGSSAWELTALNAKWFLGLDRPALPDSATNYAWAAGTLFGNGANYRDVTQGSAADCWLIASLEETVIQAPQIINNMFIDNGDGTYTVRFFRPTNNYSVLGPHVTSEYVTVDRYLPADSSGRFVVANMGASLSDPSNKLWVALAEKAYAQLDESGWTGRPADQRVNSYASLDWGYSSNALSQIAGHPATSGALAGMLATTLESDFLAHRLITFDTGATVANNVVPSHVYAMLGYFGSGANAVFVLANPWGTHAVVNGQDGSMLFLTLNQMVGAGFEAWTELNLQSNSTVVAVTSVRTLAGAGVLSPGGDATPHLQTQVCPPIVVTQQRLTDGDSLQVRYALPADDLALPHSGPSDQSNKSATSIDLMPYSPYEHVLHYVFGKSA